MKAKWFWLAYQKFILLIIMMEQWVVYSLADFWCCHVVFSVWDVVCLGLRELYSILIIVGSNFVLMLLGFLSGMIVKVQSMVSCCMHGVHDLLWFPFCNCSCVWTLCCHSYTVCVFKE